MSEKRPTTRAGRAERAAEVAAEGRQRECMACGGKGHRAGGPNCPKTVPAVTPPPVPTQRTGTGDLRADVRDELVAACRRHGIRTASAATNFAFGYLRNSAKNHRVYNAYRLHLIAEGLQDGIEIIRRSNEGTDPQ